MDLSFIDTQKYSHYVKIWIQEEEQISTLFLLEKKNLQ